MRQDGEFGNKESLEIIDGFEVILVGGKKMLKDGKVNMADVPAALELVQGLPTVMVGVQGAGDAVKEAKEYSQEELAEVGARFISMLNKVRAA